MSGCPDGRCDGSGFLYDEEHRSARACTCRPQRLARKRAASLAGRLPKRFREVSFEREPVISITRANPQVARDVQQYVRGISDRLTAGKGLWFTGDVGTGKTTFAMLVSKAAMEADHTVAIYSLPHLLAMLRETFSDNARISLGDLIDRLCSVDLLHIDDVGAEQTSAWVLEQLYTIVNTRYEDERAVLLTTNMITREGDQALRDQIGDRTVSRLYEICGQPLHMYGEDHRRFAGQEFPALPAVAAAPAAHDRWEDADPDAPSAYGRARAQPPGHVLD